MLKEKTPKCVSRCSGSGWIGSEQEKGQWEGILLSKTTVITLRQELMVPEPDRLPADHA